MISLVVACVLSGTGGLVISEISFGLDLILNPPVFISVDFFLGEIYG